MNRKAALLELRMKAISFSKDAQPYFEKLNWKYQKSTKGLFVPSSDEIQDIVDTLIDRLEDNPKCLFSECERIRVSLRKNNYEWYPTMELYFNPSKFTEMPKSTIET